jgi:hypothetical protein
MFSHELVKTMCVYNKNPKLAHFMKWIMEGGEGDRAHVGTKTKSSICYKSWAIFFQC